MDYKKATYLLPLMQIMRPLYSNQPLTRTGRYIESFIPKQKNPEHDRYFFFFFFYVSRSIANNDSIFHEKLIKVFRKIIVNIRSLKIKMSFSMCISMWD